jgi:hypothetical protein
MVDVRNYPMISAIAISKSSVMNVEFQRLSRLGLEEVHFYIGTEHVHSMSHYGVGCV